VAENLLAGMGNTEAVRKAGYSPMTAEKAAFQVVRHPYVQSILTEACARVMAKHNKGFDDILEPFVQALDAPVVVKSATEGIACIARDPDTQEIIPDHAIRMKAAEHLVGLHQGKAPEEEGQPGQGNTSPVNIQVVFVQGQAPVKPEPRVVNPGPQVAFVRR